MKIQIYLEFQLTQGFIHNFLLHIRFLDSSVFLCFRCVAFAEKEKKHKAPFTLLKSKVVYSYMASVIFPDNVKKSVEKGNNVLLCIAPPNNIEGDNLIKTFPSQPLVS